ncbi:ATP-binding protein [Verticiella sediminum]|uniref:ATP-binding protein n=1 Tax=Verticiella sediminum TaxID=1247510 RepID=A0A556AM14_9BURK|nr:ATP-binding protein [Verticiella sediminum]
MRTARTAVAACILLAAGTAWADARFGQPDDNFQGRVSAGGVVYPGSTVTLQGTNFKPGQKVQFLYEGETISGEPVAADVDGKFSVETTVPKNAVPGRHSVVVSATEPSAALIHTLKVSPDLPVSGANRFDIKSEKTVTGVYQSGYSATNSALFVAAAVGRPPVKESVLARLDPRTLKVVQQVTPGPAPGRPDAQGNAQDGGVYAVYGVGVDDANGNIWVSNTRQNTVAVYRQSDLTLLKQFDAGTIGHPRDVIADQKNGKVFVNQARGTNVAVFDAKTLLLTTTLELNAPPPPAGAGGPPGRGAAPAAFPTMSMSLDASAGKLFVVGANGEVAVIDAASNAVEKAYTVKGAAGAIGIAHDAQSNRIFIASQGADAIVIAEADTGDVLHRVPVGAGPLSVVFEPVSKRVYAANRGSGTITVLDVDGKIVANLPGGPLPNHLTVAPGGVVYALNKGQADDAASNHVQRIHAKQ